MTFREKLKMEHPRAVDPHVLGGCVGCPSMYGYEPYEASCHRDEVGNDLSCTKCWDRVIPGTESTSKSDPKLNPDLATKPNSYENLSAELHDMYTSFRNSGFTDEQALELVKSLIAAGADSMKN